MSATVIFKSKALKVTLSIAPDGPTCIRSVDPTTDPSRSKITFSQFFNDAELPLVQARLGHEGNAIYKTSKSLIGSGLASRLRYRSHREERGTLFLEQYDDESKVTVTSHLTVYDETPTLRSVTVLRNDSEHDIVVTQLSSLAIGGLTTSSANWWNDYSLKIANNSWFREAQWVEHSLPSIGLDDYGIYNTHEPHRVSSLSRFSLSNNGTFSTEGHLPMGILRRQGEEEDVWLWQIEQNGPWAWEVGDFKDSVYLAAGGPAAQAGHEWRHKIPPGQSFASVPVALCRTTNGGLDAVFSAITEYRRRIRRKHSDNVRLPVIFNDYMNCLMGDPTEDKILALLKPAVEAGSEYFVIDAGWYAEDDDWWDAVGEWQPSTTRFPSGFAVLIEKIRKAGLTPGLWLEPEVVGVRSPVVAKLPPASFFSRDGNRVVERRRYQLDFRQPFVREHMSRIIARIVNDYSIGYFKFDYNIDVTCGTDVDTSSPGSALLSHNRAYLLWIEELLDTHNGLVIENCSSGGQRMDHATLSIHPIQSVSDQEDVIRLSVIAAAAPTAVTPEQGAIWIYPQPDWTKENLAFSVVNALLGRIHLSGRLDLLSFEQFSVVKDGLDIYKKVLRKKLPECLPFWPLGLPGWSDDWLALGMLCKAPSMCFMALWCRSGQPEKDISIPMLYGKKNIQVTILYPASFDARAEWKPADCILSVEFPQLQSARLVQLRWD